MSTIDFESIATSIGKLVASKNKSYGNSFQESGKIIEMLYPNGIPVEKYTSVLALIRIIDKLYRIATQPDFNGEDAWRDIAGYAILMSGYEDAKRGKVSDNYTKFTSDELVFLSGTSGFARLDEIPILGNNKTIPILGPKPSPAMEEWAKSSTYKNSLFGAPVPHSTTSLKPCSFASINFLIKAGKTCAVSKSKLSFIPYRFVGITDIKFAPYCLR